MRWWRGQSPETDLDRELRAHLELEAKERRDRRPFGFHARDGGDCGVYSGAPSGRIDPFAALRDE